MKPMLALLVSTLAVSGARAQYAILDLGTLGGSIAGGFAVNNSGHAAGASTTETFDFNAFCADGGQTYLVQPLAGDTQSWAVCLDGADLVAAISFSHGALATHGLTWQHGIVTPLGDFAPHAIGSSGILAGCVTITDPDLGPLSRAAFWQNGSATDLGTLGGSVSFASGINGFAQVVGWSATANDAATHAALWQGGAVHDLGTLGGASSQAYGISDGRAVVGVADTAAGQPHAFLFMVDSAGAVVSRSDLGTLALGYSYAYAVNIHNEVVGTSGSRAFLWHAGQLIDLNSLLPAGSEWVLERAWSISDAGHIVGQGRHNGWPRAFLLQRACYANCDASTTPPVLNVLDFSCFLNRFAAGDSAANCDGSTTPPVLNVLDFSCFLNAFAAGCP